MSTGSAAFLDNVSISTDEHILIEELPIHPPCVMVGVPFAAGCVSWLRWLVEMVGWDGWMVAWVGEWVGVGCS